ncbi:MAG: signal peptide peptidase SppA [Thermofilaceae archaeon]
MELNEKKLIAISVVILTLIAALAFLLAQATLPESQFTPSTGYIAVIKIEGTIAYQTSQLTLFGAASNPDSISDLIDRARKDNFAKAVVLCIDSPGGSAAASEALYFKVKELASSKPVVAFIREYGTSGAYMVALPSKFIIAANSSIVGSVGVYTSVLTYNSLLEKLGVKVYVYKSGELKDIGSPYREPTQEEMEIFEKMVSEIFSSFKERVLAHRNITNSDEVFSGRPFTAREALKLGLVDRVGTYNDAIALARNLAGLPADTPVRELTPPRPGLLQLLLSGISYYQKPPVVPSVEILTVWPPLTGLQAFPD